MRAGLVEHGKRELRRAWAVGLSEMGCWAGGCWCCLVGGGGGTGGSGGVLGDLRCRRRGGRRRGGGSRRGEAAWQAAVFAEVAPGCLKEAEVAGRVIGGRREANNV